LRIFFSLVGICAALILCAVSAAMNYLFLSSLGKTPLEGQVLGAASAAADVLKALLPFFIAWSWAARRVVAAVAGSLAFAFFAGFSLLSAIGFAADNRGVMIERRDDLASAYARMLRDVQSLESQRAALPGHRPSAIVNEEIERHRQNRRWVTTKACTDATENQSRDYCATYFGLRAELAAGKEAARLLSDIAALQAEAERLRQSGAGQDGDPQVSLLSRLSGQEPEPVRLALIVAVALLVEIGASLGLFLAAGHGVTAKAGTQSAATAATGAASQDSVEDFCLEALVPSRSTVLAANDLERGYRDWCGRADRTPLRPQAFAAVFAELAATVGIPRAQGGWRGIALKHDKAALDMVS
jgi:hypothetical protein